jgi:Protein of unknown function (DUF1190)
MSTHIRTISQRLLCLLAPLAFSACSDGPSEPQAPIVRGVITTASDCVGLGSLSLEDCSKLIERAVAMHESTAPTYPKLKHCEEAEGTDKCERTDVRSYRPRLMAFMVVLGTPPEAQPLYPTMKGEVGFRTAGNDLFLPEDEKFLFSLNARSAAERYAGNSSGGGGSGGFF